MVKGKNLVCPKCGKRFKNANALTQHSLTVHAVSGPARRQPVRRAVRSKRAGSNALGRQVVSGSDRVAHFALPAASDAGASFVRVAISPQQMDATRLQAHSRLWARWRPTSLRLKIVLAGATTTFGALAAGWSPEVDFPASRPATTTPRRIAALKPSIVMRPWESGTFQIPCETTRKWYHTVGSADDASHGSFVICVDSALGGYTGNLGATVTLDWTVEFEGVELEPISGGDVVDEIGPDTGWKHLFSTSDSSWDNTRLTLKMSSGGAMVPFSSAKENHVYKPKEGTWIYYVKEDGTESQCNSLAVIQGYSTPGLALFASEKDARDYIKSGDISKILPYKSAGRWCTPDIPKFIGKPAAIVRSEDPDLEQQVQNLKDEITALRLGVHPNEVGGDWQLEG